MTFYLMVCTRPRQSACVHYQENREAVKEILPPPPRPDLTKSDTVLYSSASPQGVMGKARLMTRRFLLGLTAGIMIVVLAACATGPQPPAYRLAPDGAKEFVLRMDQGNFWPSSIYVNQGDRVRFVIHSYYQFAQFSFPQFNLNRQIPHDAPETVEFVATERGWFDFYGYVSSPYAARLTLARSFGGRDGGSDLTIHGRLYVH